MSIAEEDALVLDGDYTMAYSGVSSLHGIYRIGKWQAEDESGNQSLPEDHNHGNAAHVCETGTCVSSAGTRAGSVGRFGLESLRLQIEVREVRAGPGDGDRRRRRNFWR